MDNKPQDDSKVLGDINPPPRRSETLPREPRPDSPIDPDPDEEPGTEEDRKERPGTRDLGQSTEGTGGGTRNYRPAGTTGSDIGNRPE